MREILADAAFIPHHIGHVSVNVGGVGFVFEVTVDEGHERKHGEPGIIQAMRGVHGKLPSLGRNGDESAGR